MKLILLRHTESKSNKSNKADSQIDSELTDEGRKNAKQLVSKLKQYDIDIIIVSPLKRTSDTLKPFFKSLKTKPKTIISELTRERDLGKFSGSKMGEFQKYCDENDFDKVFHKPENGESIHDTYKRAKRFLSYLKKEFPEKTILICGHKNFLLCLETVIKNKPIKDYYSYKSFKNGELRKYNIK